ncbi:MAG: DUF6290 family protein [Litorilinea sp.]
MSDTVQMTVHVPKELRKRIRIAAAEHNRTLGAIIRDALEEYLEQLEDAELGERAQAAYQEWKRDPSTARPWEEFKAEMRADGLADE